MPGRRNVMTERVTFGRWIFEADGARLVAGGEERKLEERAARTLALLCEHRGEIVSQEEILDAVWGGRSVSANSVAVVVRDLRRALDDDARNPRFIETVAKRGYRLTAETPPPQPIRAWLAIVAIIATLAVFALTRQSAIVLAVDPVRNDTGQESYEALSRALSQVVIGQASKLAGVTVAAEGTDAKVRLEARLILWNGTPALGLTATDPEDGHVVWTGMAEGGEDVIARLTADKIGEFGRRLRHGAGSDE
jgi:DNA-binding winged helix-turn-helix (wHTH) protein